MADGVFRKEHFVSAEKFRQIISHYKLIPRAHSHSISEVRTYHLELRLDREGQSENVVNSQQAAESKKVEGGEQGNKCDFVTASYITQRRPAR